MSDQPIKPEQAEPPKPHFEPITSQEQLNALLGDRLARERAKYADYDELKAKATKFDESEAASKSELEKATEANAKLQVELDSLRLANLRHEVAAQKELQPSAVKFLTGSTREELEASADELKTLIGTRQQPRDEPVPRAGTGDPRHGAGGYEAGVERARAKRKHP